MTKRSGIFSRLIVLLIAMLFISMPISAQSLKDTLGEVKIKDTRKRKVSADDRVNYFIPGQKVTSIDSVTLQQYKQQQLSTLLTQQLPVFVRSYGFNNLATLNFRGSSAAQSLVLWNGVPLVYASLGMTDVSLLPVSLVSKVNVVYGGSAALWGSGNVGGAVMLESDAPVFDSVSHTHLSAMLGAGSFSRFNGDIKASFSSKRWYLSANVFGQSAKNNFPYTDDTGASHKMANAHLNGTGALLTAAYKESDNSTLSFTAWYQKYHREIPPALFEKFSAKQQDDASLRLLLQQDVITKHGKAHVKAAFIRDNIHYTDTTLKVLSDNTTYQFFAELSGTRRFGRHHNVLLMNTNSLAWIQLSKGVTESQSRIALAAAYTFSTLQERVKIAANARAEFINSRFVFLPGLNASFAATRWLSLRANVQRTYRAPTLGELYTFPGGNPVLKPEQGWSGDAGYLLRLKLGDAITFSHDLSYFNREIKDWIIWFGGAIWTPHNIATVHSRGVETENSLQLKTGDWRFHLGLNTSYVLAETQTSYIANDGSIGKQIPYSPRYNGQANIGFAYKGLYFNYNHTYTGYRFYTTDESAWLLPYNTGNAQLSYSFKLGIPFSAYLSCNNIWNTHYGVVAYRPMPGINYQFGLKADIL